MSRDEYAQLSDVIDPPLIEEVNSLKVYMNGSLDVEKNKQAQRKRIQKTSTHSHFEWATLQKSFNSW